MTFLYSDFVFVQKKVLPLQNRNQINVKHKNDNYMKKNTIILTILVCALCTIAVILAAISDKDMQPTAELQAQSSETVADIR